MTQKNYTILEASTLPELEALVNAKLNDGYEVAGGIVLKILNWPLETIPIVYCQAVVLVG